MGYFGQKLWNILGKNYGIYILGKNLVYIRQKLWDILWDIYIGQKSGIY